MPFSKYFEPIATHDDRRYPPPQHVQFQLPNFMRSGPPTLVPGGGAEVVHPGSSWCVNNGFTPKFADPAPPFAPTSFGFPVYSSSGFDLLSILARVVNRPYPRTTLGPVDSTCAFVVVDVRRHDSPVVYCSPSFCQLTGYDQHEVVGRNCRFLQSPDGSVQKGDPRRYQTSDAVAYLRKNLSCDKECQTTIINYRKGGAPFINLLTVIPIHGGVSGLSSEADDIVYHVGFQIDLTQQPTTILERLRDGTYFPTNPLPSPIPRKPYTPPHTPVSQDLRDLIASPAFIHSIPISTSTVVVPPPPTDKPDHNPRPHTPDPNHLLNLILLEALPDFILVVSLKGAFLYVAPAVRRVLGYEPDELVGKSIANFCHPADIVPLMRELKESSAVPTSIPDSHPDAPTPTPRTVDLLFRAQAKAGPFVWIECRGRLYVEPGKGRKTIILSGRSRRIPLLRWDTIAGAGGMAQVRAGEFWGMVSQGGVFIVLGGGVRDVLGWEEEELLGRRVGAVVGAGWGGEVEGLLGRVAAEGEGEGQQGRAGEVWVGMRKKGGGEVRVRVVVYPAEGRGDEVPLVCQVRCAGPGAGEVVHEASADVFEELATSRGSSWQYELQQLKFANRRLQDEIDALEGIPAAVGMVEVPVSEVLDVVETCFGPETLPLAGPLLAIGTEVDHQKQALHQQRLHSYPQELLQEQELIQQQDFHHQPQHFQEEHHMHRQRHGPPSQQPQVQHQPQQHGHQPRHPHLPQHHQEQHHRLRQHPQQYHQPRPPHRLERSLAVVADAVSERQLEVEVEQNQEWEWASCRSGLKRTWGAGI